MSKKNRVQRPKGELKRELVEQLELLKGSCTVYDTGVEAVGKHIALSLRVLLHSRGQSRALLDQLGMRNGRFLDTAGPLNPKNLLTDFPLVMLRVNGQGGRYIPLVAGGGGPYPISPRPFVSWWNEPVLKDDRDNMFCRRDLVLHVADTDGGAHVDAELDEDYMRISRENSLGWVIVRADIVRSFDGRPELACMRQIAHEVFLTLDRYWPEFSR